MAILAAGLALALAAAAGASDDDLPLRLAACASCHGERGEGRSAAEYYPPLAGKPAAYLFDQLAGFRDGRRHAPQMVWLLQHQSDDYLREMADYYSRLPPAAHPPVPLRGDGHRAAALVREGDAARELPACTACHGEALTGLQPGVPALLGLPADYISAQLGAWRSGVRAAVAPDCMAAVASRLGDDDIRALADWLAAQPLPEDPRPAAADSRALPLACGRMPAGESTP